MNEGITTLFEEQRAARPGLLNITRYYSRNKPAAHAAGADPSR